MSNSRYTRDEIIVQGLELADVPTCTEDNMPGGIVKENAKAVKWLQNAMDKYHRKYPFSSDVAEVELIAIANDYDLRLSSDLTLYLPEDFILDVEDGIEYPGNRLYRKDYQEYLSSRIGLQSRASLRPTIYCIINERIKVLPLVSESLTLTLHYYKLAAALEPEDVVNFPD